MEIILPAVIAALATIVAAWISRPKTIVSAQEKLKPEAPNQLNPNTSYTQSSQKPISSSLILGSCGLIAWFFPIVGIPLTLIGTGIGISHISEVKPYRFAYIGIWLNQASTFLGRINVLSRQLSNWCIYGLSRLVLNFINMSANN